MGAWISVRAAGVRRRLAKIRISDPTAALISALPSAAFALTLIATAPPDELLTRDGRIIYLSSDGVVLEAFQRGHRAPSDWRSISEFPEVLIGAVLDAEDRGFYFHPGVNPFSILRASMQNIAHGRVVSGASTITQQTVRIVHAASLPENRYLRKFVEILLAIRLELFFSKDQILEAYLNRIPMPRNRTGIPAFARDLLGRNIRHISTEEAAFLASLLRGRPGSYRTLHRRMSAILNNLNARQNRDNFESYYKLLIDDINTISNRYAPHFIDLLRLRYPDLAGRVSTELSASLNDRIQSILISELAAIERYGAKNGAAVVFRHGGETIDLVALVGSKDYNDPELGEVNGAFAVRSAGSILKPLLYARAFDRGLISPWSPLEDSPSAFPIENGEIYMPRNYELGYRGRMTAREALASSRNIPSVEVAVRLGAGDFLGLLKRSGFDHIHGSPESYGPSIALGSTGADLFRITRAYTAFASGGRLLPIRIGVDESGRTILFGERSDLFSERSALFITDILSDREIRRSTFGKRSFLDFPFDVAVKTGTSSNYVDSWSVGYTPLYTVGVWVGDFSGKGMTELSGAQGAARIFHQIVRALDRSKHGFEYGRLELVPLCRVSGKIARPECPSFNQRIDPNEIGSAFCPGHGLADQNVSGQEGLTESIRLLSPVMNETFLYDPHAPPEIQGVPVRIACVRRCQGERPSYRIDQGRPRRVMRLPANFTVNLEAGRHSISVLRNDAEVAKVWFEVRR
jgi:penicillin-binding protein 1C